MKVIKINTTSAVVDVLNKTKPAAISEIDSVISRTDLLTPLRVNNDQDYPKPYDILWATFAANVANKYFNPSDVNVKCFARKGAILEGKGTSLKGTISITFQTTKTAQPIENAIKRTNLGQIGVEKGKLPTEEMLQTVARVLNPGIYFWDLSAKNIEKSGADLVGKGDYYTGTIKVAYALNEHYYEDNNDSTPASIIEPIPATK